MTKITIAADFSVDAVEYASRANAILGIRDSGKTYTATLIAEQLFDVGIPFFAFDPIGRWRFLRAPGLVPSSPKHVKEGRGFPVVVLGGAAPDLPLTPESAPKMIRAAMQSGVSMVIDLYDVKLSKKDWRSIVRSSIEVILYENEALGGGLRHVFLEEAAEFVPQRVYDGMTYSVVEKLVRMGGNAGVGVTLINQRAEEMNKAVLELCDNLLLHRQRGKNSLLSLRKWLDAGNVKPPKEITDSLADLPTGHCWAWFKDVGRPQLIKVAPKRSFDPNRRAMSRAGTAPFRSVDVSEFVAKMKAALAGKAKPDKAVAVRPPKQEDPDVKESEAKKLRQENEQLKHEVADLRARLNGMAPSSAPAVVRPDVTGSIDMDAVYAHVVARAKNDPGVLKTLMSKPEIEVVVERRTIEMNGDTLQGKCAILISEGWFNSVQTGNAAFNELKRRGASIAKPSVYRELDKIAALGFLTKESDGYKAVEGMKVNVVEA